MKAFVLNDDEMSFVYWMMKRQAGKLETSFFSTKKDKAILKRFLRKYGNITIQTNSRKMFR